VLLGTGGLLRAYTKAAKDALSAAGISAVRRWAAVDIPCAYAALEKIKNELAAFGGAVADVAYGADVTVKALVPEEEAEALAARITDLTAGASKCAVTGFEERAVRVR
jgi:putative IMPACT (imprinted ancient) family translation regulator